MSTDVFDTDTHNILGYRRIGYQNDGSVLVGGITVKLSLTIYNNFVINRYATRPPDRWPAVGTAARR